MNQPGEVTQVAVIAIPDNTLRERLRERLIGMRWRVREARGGAEAMQHLDSEPNAELLVLDAWLPDLEIHAFADMVKLLHPTLTVLWLGRKNEVSVEIAQRNMLQALRLEKLSELESERVNSSGAASFIQPSATQATFVERLPRFVSDESAAPIPGLIGDSAPMQELSRMIRLVAPHAARVLIEGETGTGKELVARALHQLSSRSRKPYVVLNCAAIPESLLEAELFGHTRGAFTGATQSRIGRIEAAGGGTLFLDEIGEMPVGLQSKLLRFLENGELQRVGDNGTISVDVRVVAATHRNLDDSVKDGAFRLDLLHRLSVFPIEVPSLRERLDDLPALAEHFLSMLAQDMPRKWITTDALALLAKHPWPGNVRELGHVLHRGAILAGSRPEITAQEIRVRRSERG